MMAAIVWFLMTAFTAIYSGWMIKTGKTLQWSWFNGQITKAKNPISYWANVIPVTIISAFLLVFGIVSFLAFGQGV